MNEINALSNKTGKTGDSLTIRNRLTILISLVIGFISIFIYIYFPAAMEKQVISALMTKARSIADMAAFSVGSSLFSKDPVACERALAQIKGDSDLAFYSVRNVNSDTFLEHHGELAGLAGELAGESEGLSRDGQTYVIQTAIKSPPETSPSTIGWLRIGFSLHEAHIQIAKIRQTIAYLCAVIFLIGIIGAYIISTIVTRPLRMTIEMMERIVRGDLSPPASNEMRGEIGYLSRSFSDLVDNLQKARRELEERSHDLEARLQTKASELQQEMQERRRIEDELRKLSLTIEQSPNGMIIMSRDGIIEYINPKITEWTGYTKHDVVGQYRSILNLVPIPAQQNNELPELLGISHNWRGEIRNKHRDGELYWESVFITPIHDTNGQITHYLVVKEDITRQKEDKETLLQLKKAVETMQIGVTITDINGRIIYSNPADARMHGYTREELTGSHSHVFAPSESRRSLKWEQVKSMSSWRRESANVRRDGSLFPVHLWSDAVVDDDGEPIGIVTICEDITDRKMAEAALAHEKERLTVTLRSLGEGVISTDMQGCIVLINKSAENLTGWVEMDALGRPIGEVFRTISEKTGQARSDPFEMMLRTKDQISYVDYAQLISRTGGVYWVAENSAPIYHSDGHLMGMVLVFRDITEYQQLERAKSHFLNAISHELRTPLTPIIGYSEMMLDFEVSEEHRKMFLKQIIKSAQRELKLVDELLSVARLEGEGEQFNFTELNAHELFTNMLNDINVMVKLMITDRYGSSAFEYNTFLSERLGKVYISADADRIQKVTENLLSNAIKYSPSDRLSIELTIDMDESSTNGAATDYGHVIISVRDSGVGIPKTEFSNIFRPFYQIRKAKIDVSDGIGHGLFVVKRYVEAHGGKVKVESILNAGSIFTFTLPIIRTEK